MPNNETYTIHPIAHIHTDFSDKFGIPRQAGLVDALTARIVFAPEYRVAEAVRGLEQYSHLWLIWQFSQAAGRPWRPTLRAPRPGGIPGYSARPWNAPCIPWQG